MGDITFMRFFLELLASAFASGSAMSVIWHAARFSDRPADWYDVPSRLVFNVYAKAWSILTLNSTWADDVEKFSASYTTFAYIASGLVAFLAFWIIGRRFGLSPQLWKPLVILYAVARTPLAGIVAEPFVGGTLFGFVVVFLMSWGLGIVGKADVPPSSVPTS